MEKCTPTVVAKAAEWWQRCRQEELRRAFYAFDEDKQQSERAVSYRLAGKDNIEALIKEVENPEQFHFIVHLGLRGQDVQGPILDTPPFLLYLQASNGADDWQQNCFELSWVKDSRFSRLMEDGTDSGQNAIPAASAYLFVQAWLELPEVALAVPFSAASRVMGQRVKAYSFSMAESHSIYLDLTNSKKYCLDVHLGKGMAVWDHPFSFRPVLEVRGAVTDLAQRTRPVNATGLTNPEGDSFYDFGQPIPPGHPG